VNAPDLCFTPATDLVRLFRSRKTSPYPTDINGKPLENYTQWFFLTYAITVTGLPAISVPCGFTRDGLPVGLQIVGRRRQEAAVLRAAAAVEAASPWARNIPPVLASPR
jgi:Asp-tRNA(Asn)/Glu-tRNA(Gln) amidotransferase A subunit family amidase